MKFNKTLILTGLLALGGLTASAQEQQEKTENVFNPHWYIEVQPLGMQYTLGEVSFGDLLSYNLQVQSRMGDERSGTEVEVELCSSNG